MCVPEPDVDDELVAVATPDLAGVPVAVAEDVFDVETVPLAFFTPVVVVDEL